MKMRHFLFSILLTIVFSQNSNAQTENFQTENISIFKNGQAFFIKSGQLKSADGKYLFPNPAPQALYGTLWFSSPSDELERVASYPDTLVKKETGPTVHIWDLLRKNIGKNVSLQFSDDRIFKGKIISVSPTGKDEKGQPVFSTESLVTLKSGEGEWLTMPAIRLPFPTFESEPNLEVETTTRQPRHVIEVDFLTKKASQPLDLMYLANGLNWTPQYLLELTGENSGNLTMQGEVVNDVEDIKNTTVNLVVGVPNFAYADKLAALVDFLKVVQPVVYRQLTNAAVFSNSITSQSIGYGNLDESLAERATPTTSQNEDLFFFTLENFSLPKGGRSMHHIFEEKVEIAHIYECQLPGNDENENYYASDFLFSPQVNKVFHTIRMKNQTEQPWTTAPILVMNAQGERRPLSQDLMKYTPVGAKNYVKLTDAVDVKVTQAEREISRQERVWKNLHRQDFDLVEVEGKITVKNFKDKKLKLRLMRTIYGDLKNSSVEWQKEEVVNTDNTRNRKTNVSWEPSVGEKGELEIVYTYNIYVRSY